MRALIALFFISILISCNSTIEDKAHTPLETLVGKWEFTGTQITEEWTKQSDGNYHAEVVNNAGWEPEIVELIDVTREADGLYFAGTILNQNNALPIHFKLVEADKDYLNFENQAHDFPQNISYRIINENKVRAKISGSQDGSYREQEFVYYRIQPEN